MAGDTFRQRAAGVADEIYFGAEIGERPRMVLHARAAPEIAEDDHRRIDLAVAAHGSITEYMLKSTAASSFRLFESYAKTRRDRVRRNGGPHPSGPRRGGLP